MENKHLKRYQELYTNLGMEPEQFDDDARNMDEKGRKAKLQQMMTHEFCRSLCPDCSGCGD